MSSPGAWAPVPFRSESDKGRSRLGSELAASPTLPASIDSPPSPQTPPEGDATRRTWLANERTYLAWLRTALTAFAVALGVGKLVPELVEGTTWPYAAVGVGFAVFGVVLVVCGLLRLRAVDRAIAEGRYAPVDRRLVLLLSGLAALLGALLVVLLLVEG